MREARFGNRTLSSLAFPILVSGSSTSRSMLNLAEKAGIIKLVRKSLSSGSAVARSSSGLTSGTLVFFRLKLFPNDVVVGDG